MTTLLEHCTWTYNQGDALDRLDDPYEFGGGHPTPVLPWVKLNHRTGEIESAKGPDCSGGISNMLWHGGLLGTPISKVQKTALSTRDFESWGAPGKGEDLTVWVINITGLEHCFIEFNLPGKRHHWWAAPHAGSHVGWQNYVYWKPEEASYKPRHPLL